MIKFSLVVSSCGENVCVEGGRQTSILRQKLKGKARTHTNLLRVVLGSCAKCCPCEASEQKMGPKSKSQTKKIKL